MVAGIAVRGPPAPPATSSPAPSQSPFISLPTANAPPISKPIPGIDFPNIFPIVLGTIFPMIPLIRPFFAVCFAAASAAAFANFFPAASAASSPTSLVAVFATVPATSPATLAVVRPSTLPPSFLATLTAPLARFTAPRRNEPPPLRMSKILGPPAAPGGTAEPPVSLVVVADNPLPFPPA